MYNEFDPKHYKGKCPCTTKTLYNEKTLTGRLHQYFLIYFETFSVPTADTLFLLIPDSLQTQPVFLLKQIFCYCAMKILPYQDEQFPEYRTKSVQEFRFN